MSSDKRMDSPDKQNYQYRQNIQKSPKEQLMKSPTLSDFGVPIQSNRSQISAFQKDVVASPYVFLNQNQIQQGNINDLYFSKITSPASRLLFQQQNSSSNQKLQQPFFSQINQQQQQRQNQHQRQFQQNNLLQNQGNGSLERSTSGRKSFNNNQILQPCQKIDFSVQLQQKKIFSEIIPPKISPLNNSLNQTTNFDKSILTQGDYDGLQNQYNNLQQKVIILIEENERLIQINDQLMKENENYKKLSEIKNNYTEEKSYEHFPPIKFDEDSFSPQKIHQVKLESVLNDLKQKEHEIEQIQQEYQKSLQEKLYLKQELEKIEQMYEGINEDLKNLKKSKQFEDEQRNSEIFKHKDEWRDLKFKVEFQEKELLEKQEQIEQLREKQEKQEQLQRRKQDESQKAIQNLEYLRENNERSIQQKNRELERLQSDLKDLRENYKKEGGNIEKNLREEMEIVRAECRSELALVEQKLRQREEQNQDLEKKLLELGETNEEMQSLLEQLKQKSENLIQQNNQMMREKQHQQLENEEGYKNYQIMLDKLRKGFEQEKKQTLEVFGKQINELDFEMRNRDIQFQQMNFEVENYRREITALNQKILQKEENYSQKQIFWETQIKQLQFEHQNDIQRIRNENQMQQRFQIMRPSNINNNNLNIQTTEEQENFVSPKYFNRQNSVRNPMANNINLQNNNQQTLQTQVSQNNIRLQDFIKEANNNRITTEGNEYEFYNNYNSNVGTNNNRIRTNRQISVQQENENYLLDNKFKEDNITSKNSNNINILPNQQRVQKSQSMYRMRGPGSLIKIDFDNNNKLNDDILSKCKQIVEGANLTAKSRKNISQIM